MQVASRAAEGACHTAQPKAKAFVDRAIYGWHAKEPPTSVCFVELLKQFFRCSSQETKRNCGKRPRPDQV